MPTARARILVATAGTWGDLLPFVELGRRLVSRGHEVTIACATGMQEWVKRAGLNAAPFDGDFGKEVAQKHAKSWDHWDYLEARSGSELDARAQAASFAERISRNSQSLAELAREADFLLTPTNCPEGRRVHEQIGIPWLSVVLMPEQGVRNEVRGLNGEKRSTPALFACSEALIRAEDPSLLQTGFWFYEDSDWAQWKPDDQLMRFMEEDPPLVLSFSSLPLANSREVLEVHLRAARLLGRKLVVQKGWAGFSLDLLPSDVDPKQVYMAEFLPHDWFFSRAAGLITHGGVGTLGRALRNACPILVEPYGNDQFYNALLVIKHGYGAAVHPRRLNAESLASVIREKLFSSETRERVAQAAEIIRREEGVGRACELLEEFLGRARRVA